jgi:hypothetical protein
MQDSAKNAMDSILDQIEIASPCLQSWDAMEGDDCKRFCQACKMDIFNLSSMSKSEITDLLLSAEQTGDKVCGRFYRRLDGTIMTRDCPVGVRILNATRRNFDRARQVAVVIAGVCVALLTGKLAFQHSREYLLQSISTSFSQIAAQSGGLNPVQVQEPVTREHDDYLTPFDSRK